MITDILPLIKNRKFISLWVSQLFSQLTIHIMNFLLLFRLYDGTGSSIATSLLWLAYALPAIIVGPFASAYTDMADRKKVLVATNLLQSAVVFLYAYSQMQSLFLVYGVAFAYSLLNQFYVPAELATLPSVVRKKRLAQANGFFFMTQQTALIAGFGISGFMLRHLGFEVSLLVCAAFLFAASVSVMFLPRLRAADKLPKSFEKTFVKFFKRIIEGYQFIKEHREILSPFLLLMALQIALAIVAVNAPFLATELFGIDPTLIGIILIVPVGLGAAVGSIGIPRLLKKGYRKIFFIKRSLELISASLLLLSFFVPLLTVSLRLPAIIILLMLLGLGFVGVTIPSQTFLQEKTPGGLRGRVFGNFWFLNTIATLFPVILSGALTEILGARFLTMALSFSFLGLLVFINRYGASFIARKTVDVV